jgi:ribosomal-protein-alanine N-acetyltransferase
LTPIRTARLELRPLPAAAAEALPHDRRSAADLIGATLPPCWPQVDLLDVLPMQAAAGPEDEGFGLWLMIDAETGSVIGDVGFIGPPVAGVVEIGFSVVPDRRRHGYATEAVGAMVDRVLQGPTVHSVVARCDAENVASIGVLEATGFVRTGASDGLVHWCRDATTA